MMERSLMLKEVLVGLSQSQKSIHPKYLYDKTGSEIFEAICKMREYYPTRAENEILKANASSIAKLIGPGAMLIEPGSGAGEKVRFLIPYLARPVGYVPVEISEEILERMTEEFKEEFPRLPVFPICADFTRDFSLPEGVHCWDGKKTVFFPGSTIGNLNPQEAILFLKRMSKLVAPDGGLLIGVDLKKNKETLKLAYDDPNGITAAFNLNLLRRMNREAAADFDPESFVHEAFYNEEAGRVEMHLVSTREQLVKVNQSVFRFQTGESIHTESSYKYSTDEFCELALRAKLNLVEWWQDEKKMFCVYYFHRG